MSSPVTTSPGREGEFELLSDVELKYEVKQDHGRVWDSFSTSPSSKVIFKTISKKFLLLHFDLLNWS
ncbi:hypothetical protein HanRHA438_Chr14g0656321 [Helianthus annuus]|nr:hypothetical protein HanRHA438_Chr14g0656321 [Helianthus annuus]